MTREQAVDVMIGAVNSKPPIPTGDPLKDIARYEQWEEQRNEQFLEAHAALMFHHTVSGVNGAMVIEMAAADNDDDKEEN